MIDREEVKNIIENTNGFPECFIGSVSINNKHLTVLRNAALEYLRMSDTLQTALQFAQWVVENYDDNWFEELYNRAQAIIDGTAKTDNTAALDALDKLDELVKFLGMMLPPRKEINDAFETIRKALKGGV